MYNVLIDSVVGGFITGMMFRSRTPLSVTSFEKNMNSCIEDKYILFFPFHNVKYRLIKNFTHTTFKNFFSLLRRLTYLTLHYILLYLRMMVPYNSFSDWLLAVTCPWEETSYLLLASCLIPSAIVAFSRRVVVRCGSLKENF